MSYIVRSRVVCRFEFDDEMVGVCGFGYVCNMLVNLEVWCCIGGNKVE